ncbi:Hpr(Ser) kinase/phosphatase [Palleronia marisminoris]|uniref:HPr kinase/phosphorylase n=1 Tax=Palleronia marisminoris TaxID=315423 RepID=A0A1Y5T5U6_9RHOB|nr:HPr kinase/phosphatase C-terminal domain-containing protein [Palleronia marisminoris]SFH17662.1 Hpr(Ser) kinase/phosphatase [Palleronia marisminoris]SLN56125.1 HPr kinase/phosphorylase [Palleronia marisminoris]
MTLAPGLTLHASAVAVSGRGVLLRGAAGTGKSTLALALIARGGRLIADDRTCLARRGEGVLAWAPAPILGLIEARGIGLIETEPAPPTVIAAVVDLDEAEPHRLPPARFCDLAGASLPLVLGAGMPHLADALILFLTSLRRITA